MGPSVGVIELTDGELRRRFHGLVSHLDHWGDVIAVGEGGRRDRRRIELAVLAPGAGLAPEVKTLFREYYARVAPDSWRMTKYTYEYLDTLRGVRLAFHMHDVGGTALVPHAHCESASDIPEAERSPHLRAIEYDVREANEVFVRLYAAELAPSCRDFLQLEIDRS